MRKLIDFIHKILLKLTVSYLCRHYDLFFDGLEVWITEKISPIDEEISDVIDGILEGGDS